jgi:hypothetical protein
MNSMSLGEIMTSKILSTAMLLLLLMGCGSMPETRIQSTDSRPRLAIQGAPQNSILYVDGIIIGQANDYNGDPNILIILPGTHKISIKNSVGQSIHDQTIFVESELKTIILSGQK